MNKLIKVGTVQPTVIPKPESRSSNRIRSMARRFIFENRRSILLCSALIILGALMGIIAYIRMNVSDKNLIFSYMQNYFGGSVIIGASPAEILKSSFMPQIVTGVIIAAAGIFTVFYPFALARLSFKGFSMGFAAAFFIARYGAKGAAFALVSVVLCNIISVTASVWFLLECRSIRKAARPIAKRPFILRLIPEPKCAAQVALCFGIFIAAAFVAALFESVIGHGMMRSLYGIFSAF